MHAVRRDRSGRTSSTVRLFSRALITICRSWRSSTVLSTKGMPVGAVVKGFITQSRIASLN